MIAMDLLDNKFDFISDFVGISIRNHHYVTLPRPVFADRIVRITLVLYGPLDDLTFVEFH